MTLESTIDKKLNELPYLNIIITGMTCSGKTTISNKLKQHYGNVVSQIPQDNYFKDLADIPRNRNGYLLDSINAFHTEEFEKDIKNLLGSNQIFIPDYDIKNNRRIKKDILIRKGKINIFEGLHTIALLKDLSNKLTIFVDAPLEICLERRIKRDQLKYGIEEETIKQYFNLCISPLSKNYIFPQKDLADVIVDERGKILCR